MDKQIRRFQVPFKEEGFEEIKIYDLPIERDSLPNMRDFDQKNPHHTMNLYDHCWHTASMFMKYSYPRCYVIAALWHDCGKIYTQTFDEDKIAHYYGHSEFGSYVYLSSAHHIYTDGTLDICFLINYHMLPFGWEKASEKTKQRWKKRFGEYKYQMLLDFHECDIAR